MLLINIECFLRGNCFFYFLWFSYWGPDIIADNMYNHKIKKWNFYAYGKHEWKGLLSIHRWALTLLTLLWRGAREDASTGGTMAAHHQETGRSRTTWYIWLCSCGSLLIILQSENSHGERQVSMAASSRVKGKCD